MGSCLVYKKKRHQASVCTEERQCEDSVRRSLSVSMVAHVYNCNTREMEAGESTLIQGQFGLPDEFEASLKYIERPCLENIK